MNIAPDTGVDRTALGAYTELAGTHEIVTWTVDILNRFAEKYRAKDLPALGAIAYGDPLGLTLPIIAVIPAKWNRERKDLSRPAFRVEKRDRLLLRVYLHLVEDEDPASAYKAVTRTGDYLAALFMEHRQLETAAVPAIARVYEAFPGEGRIQSWMEKLRGSRDGALIRGCEIDLNTLVLEKVTTDP